MLETILSVCLGVGLAASCGFRVFVPLLVVSISARAGFLSPSEGFEWLGSWPAIAALSVATLLEIGAYYFPWLDNLLDTISTPAAVVAGVLAAAACVSDTDPLLKWSVAVIAGGGSAGVIKAGMVGVRALSTGLTGGFGNALVATGEWIAALAMSALAFLVPIAAAALSIVLVIVLGRFAIRVSRRLFTGPRLSSGDEQGRG
jgi:hypothetical protein